ncbi:hypothetical protein C8A05DRAFT_16269 [Staphylotrichum tortipilum]|uniref:Uncharacterized protein n=1 Tax=Staphylotrichum tortipilum TaxID=2831512 RepID=A0AAN6RSQ1_9PEZI|nr:hypothetical protein C8A05DRAFT_16269 [Staphylotrichum longicolle]
MGKPNPNPAPAPVSGSGRAGSSSDSDAVSLHTQPGDRMYDDDVPELQADELPPLYSDIDADATANAPLLPTTLTPTYIHSDVRDDEASWHKIDQNTGAEFFISPALDSDPKLLEAQIRLSATKPPRPSLRVLGTHSETVRENGKSKSQTVTDFDVSVDLTPYLFGDATQGLSWKTLRTVEDTEKTYRGTVFRKRAPGVKRDLEITNPKPTLAEWCHRYCASHTGVKSFELRRKVLGFEEYELKLKLVDLVRGTNYRGHVQVTFPVKGDVTLIYNDSKINQWRLTPWIVWLCYLTFMWLFTWPFLFFRTKRFEVAVSEWPFSVDNGNGTRSYVSMSESHIYNLWARAIHRAVLDKRQCTLDRDDLIASQTAPDQPLGRVLDGAPRFLREGINAITAVHRQLGWGGDSC